MLVALPALCSMHGVSARSQHCMIRRSAEEIAQQQLEQQQCMSDTSISNLSQLNMY